MRDEIALKAHMKQEVSNDKVNLGHFLSKWKYIKEPFKSEKIYKECDANQNGFLEIEEAVQFMEKIKTYIDPERLDNYNEERFRELFKIHDTEMVGYVMKPEIAVLVKKAFAPVS